jgi:hypothetical protein
MDTRNCSKHEEWMRHVLHQSDKVENRRGSPRICAEEGTEMKLALVDATSNRHLFGI